jgi:hypothetical protein
MKLKKIISIVVISLSAFFVLYILSLFSNELLKITLLPVVLELFNFLIISDLAVDNETKSNNSVLEMRGNSSNNYPGNSQQDSELNTRKLIHEPLNEDIIKPDDKKALIYNNRINSFSHLTLSAGTYFLWGKMCGLPTRAATKFSTGLTGIDYYKDKISGDFKKTNESIEKGLNTGSTKGGVNSQEETKNEE